MSAERLEAFLAQIYIDEKARERFLSDPRGEASKAGLNERELEALARLDRVGLILTVRSLQKKRKRAGGRRREGLLARARSFARFLSILVERPVRIYFGSAQRRPKDGRRHNQ